MPKFALLAVGKTQTELFSRGIEHYLGRIKHYIPLEFQQIPDLKSAGKIAAAEQKNLEGKLILKELGPSDYLVLLDERGKEFTSRGFAEYIEKLSSGGAKRVVFLIGGPYGFSEEVYARANAKISLSKMTFTHEMIRLLFVEQYYRAMTILRGEPYHHD